MAKQYIAVISGQYMRFTEDTGMRLTEYREAFSLESAEAALSTVVRNYLLPRLRKKDDGITSVYTHVLEALFPKGDPTGIDGIPLSVMNLAQLDKYCAARGLTCDVEVFENVHVARELIARSQISPGEFAKAYADYIEKAKFTRPVAELPISEKEQEDILKMVDAAKRTSKKPKSGPSKAVVAAKAAAAADDDSAGL